MWRFIGKRLLVFIGCSLPAVVLARTEGDSIPKKHRSPIWISAGFDLSRPALAFLSRNQSGLEGSVDFRNARYLTGANLGYAQRTFTQPNYRIVDQGIYGTLGMARSLFPEQGQALAFGLWAGYSRFSNRSADIQVPLFPGPGQRDIAGRESNHAAFWLEFRGLIRTQIYSWLMLGLDVRLRTLLRSPDNMVPVYFIPGYGLRKNRLSPGITYSIFVQLPFRASRAGKTDQNPSGESGSQKNPPGR